MFGKCCDIWQNYAAAVGTYSLITTSFCINWNGHEYFVTIERDRKVKIKFIKHISFITDTQILIQKSVV